MIAAAADANLSGSFVVYDGECVFCQNYVQFVRLRNTIGPVELIDARSGDPRVKAVEREGLDLDEGMVFVWNGRIFHGEAAVHVLAGLSSDLTFASRLNRKIFSNRVLARIFYPALKFGRRITLLARGRKLIKETRA